MATAIRRILSVQCDICDRRGESGDGTVMHRGVKLFPRPGLKASWKYLDMCDECYQEYRKLIDKYVQASRQRPRRKTQEHQEVFDGDEPDHLSEGRGQMFLIESDPS